MHILTYTSHSVPPTYREAVVPEQLQLSGQSAGNSEPGTLGLIPSDCHAVFSLFCLILQQCVDVEHSYLRAPIMLNPLGTLK